MVERMKQLTAGKQQYTSIYTYQQYTDASQGVIGI